MSRWLALVSLTVLGIFALSGARQGSDDGSVEFVLGSHYCSASVESAFVYMGIQSSGDLFLGDNPYLSNQPAVAGSPAETCDPRTAAMRELLTGYGCSLGATSLYQDDSGGVQQGFSFVCEGTRTRMVRTLAAAARGLVEIEAP